MYTWRLSFQDQRGGNKVDTRHSKITGDLARITSLGMGPFMNVV
jgi:hypothetical protein